MSASVVTVAESGAVTVTQASTADVVTVETAGSRGPPGPLGDWLGVLYIDGKPGSGETVIDVVPNEALILGADLEGWYVSSRTEAEAEAVATVLVEDVEVGTITWGPAETVAVLATTGNDTIAVGALDHLTIVFPEPPDDTLANISIRMRAERA